MSRLLAGFIWRSDTWNSVSRLWTSCRAGSPGLPMHVHPHRFRRLFEAVINQPAHTGKQFVTCTHRQAIMCVDKQSCDNAADEKSQACAHKDLLLTL